MSGEGTFWERCTCGKRGYADRVLAETALERTVADNAAAGTPNRGLGTYRCRTGGMWHVGHGHGRNAGRNA